MILSGAEARERARQILRDRELVYSAAIVDANVEDVVDAMLAFAADAVREATQPEWESGRA